MSHVENDERKRERKKTLLKSSTTSTVIERDSPGKKLTVRLALLSHFLPQSRTFPLFRPHTAVILKASFCPIHRQTSLSPLHPPPEDTPRVHERRHTPSADCLSSIFCSTPHSNANRWITFLPPELCTSLSPLRTSGQAGNNAVARALPGPWVGSLDAA